MRQFGKAIRVSIFTVHFLRLKWISGRIQEENLMDLLVGGIPAGFTPKTSLIKYSLCTKIWTNIPNLLIIDIRQEIVPELLRQTWILSWLCHLQLWTIGPVTQLLLFSVFPPIKLLGSVSGLSWCLEITHVRYLPVLNNDSINIIIGSFWDIICLALFNFCPLASFKQVARHILEQTWPKGKDILIFCRRLKPLKIFCWLSGGVGKRW